MQIWVNWNDPTAAVLCGPVLQLKPRPPATNFFCARADRSQIVLDGVTQTYNIGGIFRPCDAFPVQELVVCVTKAELAFGQSWPARW
jgi:tRNA G18 (ribose-2'-O)-methylase SpoU